MKKGSPTLIITVAVALVAIVSLLPLSQWSGGRIKDFSLISDLVKEIAGIDHTDPAGEQIDPELLRAMEEAEANNPLTASDSVLALPVDSIIHEPKSPRQGDLVVIEDYTTHQGGLVQLANSLAQEGSLTRIAVVGDSYIEGDIFTQDLRSLMQRTWGGQGVGYVSMHSDFPGFRRSVRQGGSGWTTHMANKKADPQYLTLSEQYATPKGTATATYKGAKEDGPTASWSRSRLLCVPAGGPATVMLATQQGEPTVHNIAAGDSVVCIEAAGPTDLFEVTTSSQGLVALGVWLDGDSGVSLDCMSSRGFSGITLTRINAGLCRQEAAYIDYRLIILEFGINAMSASQKDYSVYSGRMVEVINHVRKCYPRADILLMGVGDRGVKSGGAVVSMATAQAMVTAQRDAARRARCLFWDTREAMGGDGAVVQWCNQGLINKDYIHMTHKGGARLAQALYRALCHSLCHEPTAAAGGDNGPASIPDASTPPANPSLP